MSPYIAKSKQHVAEFCPSTAGELTYALSVVVDRYLANAAEKHGLSYAMLNECIGALEVTKHELYRRICAPYEDKKLAENGDIWRTRIHVSADDQIQRPTSPGIEPTTREART